MQGVDIFEALSPQEQNTDQGDGREGQEDGREGQEDVDDDSSTGDTLNRGYLGQEKSPSVSSLVDGDGDNFGEDGGKEGQ